MYTNLLFLNQKILKCFDIAEFQTVQFLFIARKGMFPCKLQSKFQERNGRHKLREELNFKVPKQRKTKRSFSPTVNGVQLSNGIEKELETMSRHWPIKT